MMKSNKHVKHIFATFLILSIVFVISGCKKNELDKVTTNTLVLNENSSLTVATIDSFDQKNYDQKELKKYVKDEIGRYNESKGENSLVLEKLSIKDQIAKMILRYKNADTYSDLTKIELIICNINKLEGLKKELPQEFNMINGETIGIEDVLELSKSENAQVMLINENYDVILKDKLILYYSGATNVSNTTATIKDQDTTSYLIFKDSILE